MRRTIYIALSVVLAAAVNVSAEPVWLDGVVAQVNNHIVTRGDVEAALAPIRAQLQKVYSGSEYTEKLDKAYADTLDAVVERWLILDAYEQGQQKLPDWVVDERINDIVHESFEDDRGALLTALTVEQMTYDEWRTRMRDQLIVSVMRNDRIERHTRVSPRAIKAAYDANPGKYRSPDTVKLRLVVINKGDAAEKKQKIEDIKKRLDSGEDFGAVAKSSSEGRKAEAGGDWGWMEPSQLRPELAEAVQKLEPGRASDIVEAEGDFYIIAVDERKAGSAQSFEQVQTKIERELRVEEARGLYNAWIDGLKKNAYVKIIQPAVSAPAAAAK